ncbi:8-oxo-dGTP pyrophosphatase MutT (NUDIX family) [Sphingomonas sp. BE138]|uniref:NUDIX hydrolase n=1 Tax=Sphingomonas sp. BE138 TaxID=2817845 RepID=UPI002861371A|nr:NUDIX domain-containing protein [Sphingomonas sp. BE138]MDR6789334.1 8-oxo-dGTP pyrophosphatase MutT (NUDIX family) [Sphingomonas sp. BE138]
MTNPAIAADAIPAATLIVMRDRSGADPEILMVERAGAMAFAPGAMVFPGGRVDPADVSLAQMLSPADLDDGAARIAAIRETIEEAGLPIGLSAMPDAAALATLRTALRRGVPFGPALAAIGATLATDALVPFARWCPAHRIVRRFDARFYLAALPADAPAPQVDGTENVRLCWASARAVLDDAAAGRLTLIFPTRRNLERLALFRTHAAAVADARARPSRTIVPWLEQRNGEDYLCIPDDLGYPITAERLDAVQRG